MQKRRWLNSPNRMREGKHRKDEEKSLEKPSNATKHKFKKNVDTNEQPEHNPNRLGPNTEDSKLNTMDLDSKRQNTIETTSAQSTPNISK